MKCRREAEAHADVDDKIYFAVGSDAEESWPNLSWVARNFAGWEIWFIHILQPTRMIPSKHSPRGGEKQRIQKILKKYQVWLRNAGLKVGEEIYLKMEDIGEGITKLISVLEIKNLVMEAAAREMIYFETKITKYVSVNGPSSCQIWFLNEGHLIKTRYQQVITGGCSEKETYEESVRRQKAEIESAEAAFKEMQLAREVISGSSSSQSSGTTVSSFSSLYAPSAPPAIDVQDEESEEKIVMEPIAWPKEMTCNSSPYNVPKEAIQYDELFEQLEQAMAEVEKSKIETFEESSRRQKAEKAAVEAFRRAIAAEKKMNEQLIELTMTRNEKSTLEDEIAEIKKDNKEMTEKIVISVELLQRYKNERDELKVAHDRALRAAEEMRHSAESSESGGVPQLLSEFSFSEIDEATCHFDPSLKIDERGYWRIYKGVLWHTEVAIKLLDASNSKGSSEYRREVEALSRLRHPNIVTLIGAWPEALAIIYEHSLNGSLEDRLNCKDNSFPLPWQTRICIAADLCLCAVLVFLHSSKSHCIVHGDLKPCNILLDQNFGVKLSHFGLSRTITTTESTPKSDINKLSKLLTRMVTQRAVEGGSSQNSSFMPPSSVRTKPPGSRTTQPSDTFVYMDLESVMTGTYTPELDVYSFGIILLRLLTGREAWGLTKDVQLALDSGDLHSLLDWSAGDWPYLQAQQLAQIALRCADVSRRNRPDLESKVLGVLRTMKAMCGGSPMTSGIQGDNHSQAPPYYICPITQDVMQDPHVAADGYTYEKEGIQGWLSSHHTSPMTNLKLDHKNLVPNRALRSAIQEWKLHL